MYRKELLKKQVLYRENVYKRFNVITSRTYNNEERLAIDNA